MKAVEIEDAERQLDQLVNDVTAGEDVVVCRNGEPLVRITKMASPKRRIRFGLLEGKLTVPADFDAPLPNDVLAGFRTHR